MNSSIQSIVRWVIDSRANSLLLVCFVCKIINCTSITLLNMIILTSVDICVIINFFALLFLALNPIYGRETHFIKERFISNFVACYINTALSANLSLLSVRFIKCMKRNHVLYEDITVRPMINGVAGTFTDKNHSLCPSFISSCWHARLCR